MKASLVITSDQTINMFYSIHPMLNACSKCGHQVVSKTRIHGMEIEVCENDHWMQPIYTKYTDGTFWLAGYLEFSKSNRNQRLYNLHLSSTFT